MTSWMVESHNDYLKGGTGNDTLIGGSSEDEMTGGAGNDLYSVTEITDHVIELAAGGTDTIQTNVNNLNLASYDDVEVLNSRRSDRHQRVRQRPLRPDRRQHRQQRPDRWPGQRRPGGGGGADTVNGGKGNDSFFVDSSLDVVIEAAGEGKDAVIANADFVLTAGQEIEILKLDGATDPFGGTGNGLANTIIGNDGDDDLQGGGENDTLNGAGGNDTLSGQAGNDSMNGGKGDDLYVVEDAGDKVTEAANQGTDAVLSTLGSYTLSANVENMLLSGSALNGTGNTLNNGISGNGLANKLDGGGGNDTLNAGGGVDTMTGGTGNDVYLSRTLATP